MEKPILETEANDDHRRRAQAVEWWLKMRAGQPSPEDIAAWLDWHAGDPRNAEAFESVREFAGRVRATDPAALGGLIAEFSPPMHPARSRWLGWPMRVGIAAATIIAVFVAYQLLAMPPAKPSRLKFQTPVAINRDIALPDGSSVVLGGQSELNATFTPSARSIELSDGEAYFKVRHDGRRPCYVHAGKLTVRDVGTAFDVSKVGERVAVTVAQGRVQVTETDPEAQGGSATNTVDIGAGQQVLYSPGAAGLRVARVDPAGALGWREQRLEFVNAPLSFVVANINRYAQRPLQVHDPAIGRLTFTGTVDLHSLDRWLAALQTIFPVRVEYGADGDAIVPQTASQRR